MIELSSHVRCDIIDYAYLTQQCAIEPFQAKVQLTVGDTIAVSCVTKPIAIRFGPAIGHTLAVSAQLWAQAYCSYDGEGDITASSDEFQVLYDQSYLLTYLLTLWCRVLLEKLTGFAAKKFPAFYQTRKFITIFTSARHLSLS